MKRMKWCESYHGVCHYDGFRTTYFGTIEDYGNFAEWNIYSRQLNKYLFPEDKVVRGKNCLSRAKKQVEKWISENAI